MTEFAEVYITNLCENLCEVSEQSTLASPQLRINLSPFGAAFELGRHE